MFAVNKTNNKSYALNGQTGFTLLEIMLSSLIFSLLAMGLYSLFYGAIRNYQKIESTSKLNYAALLIFRDIEQNYKNAVIYTRGQDSGFTGKGDSVAFYTLLPRYINQKRRLFFSKVEYLFNAPGISETIRSGAQLISQDSDFTTVELMDNVVELNFEYAWQNSASENSLEWQDTWPATNNPVIGPKQKKEIPVALRVKLVVHDKKLNQSAEFTRVIPFYQDTGYDSSEK